ncbi:Striatin [Acipenser ruthenus]|uniref:Striatin n=1 Tax=Acipenser ruthenus TaxID=7906 RepID=A0A662YLV3_ACIRT|nr:Striatin [Acipenser ruthenus]
MAAEIRVSRGAPDTQLCQPSTIRAFLPSLAMDEQAGPGVFFNNNNNSVLSGSGKGPGPQPEGGGGEAARAQYSIPGILHFLQHEWARFEVERAQWDVERAELQHHWYGPPGNSNMDADHFPDK